MENVAIARLAGICMEYRENMLIGVRITGVLECIRARHPDLSPLIPKSTTLDVTKL